MLFQKSITLSLACQETVPNNEKHYASPYYSEQAKGILVPQDRKPENRYVQKEIIPHTPLCVLCQVASPYYSVSALNACQSCVLIYFLPIQIHTCHDLLAIMEPSIYFLYICRR